MCTSTIPTGAAPDSETCSLRPLLKILHEADYPGYISVEVFDFEPDPQTIAGSQYGIFARHFRIARSQGKSG